MMYSYFKCMICFLWIIQYALCTETKNETSNPQCPAGKFNAIPLGHDNLLITWEPDKDPFNDFHFDFKPVGEKLWEGYRENFLFENGWYKITYPLTENTQYEMKAWNYLPNLQYWECTFQVKTNPKKYSFPTKPDFKVSMMNELKQFFYSRYGSSFLPKVRIEWLPCGKKKYCDSDEIAGVKFAVKYRMLNSTQEWRTIEKYVPYKYIYGLLPGKEYEVVVASIYGNLLTDSDPQVISIKSFCSPVQSVKIMSLPDSSIFISWKSPKQCQVGKHDWLGYTVFYHIADNSPTSLLNYTVEEKPYKENIFVTEFENPRGVKYGQTKLLNLSIGTTYTFYVIPATQLDVHHGTEYRIDYVPETYVANLSLAKPDFEYKFGRNYGAAHCNIIILWLPCGQTYDCKNMKPGSYFVVKYREGKGEIQETIEKTHDRTSGYVQVSSKKKYEFWVESVDQSDRVKSESKIIDTSKCEEN